MTATGAACESMVRREGRRGGSATPRTPGVIFCAIGPMLRRWQPAWQPRSRPFVHIGARSFMFAERKLAIERQPTDAGAESGMRYHTHEIGLWQPNWQLSGQSHPRLRPSIITRITSACPIRSAWGRGCGPGQTNDALVIHEPSWNWAQPWASRARICSSRPSHVGPCSSMSHRSLIPVPLPWCPPRRVTHAAGA